jgi:hypothetical protein
MNNIDGIKMMLDNEVSNENIEITELKVLESNISGELISYTSNRYSLIYRVKLNDGRVYIGQTDDYQNRSITHKTNFGSNFHSIKVVKHKASIMDEINYIKKYRIKLGYDKVVNIQDGSPVPEATKLNVTRWLSFTPTQLAIKTFMLVEQYGISDIKARTLTGLKSPKAVGYVRKIKASKLDKEYKIIETLLKGEAANIRGKRTKSIDVAKREVSRIEEEEHLKNTSEEIDINKVVDFDEYLNTETAKAKFWEIYGNKKELTIEDKLFTCELLNAKYTLKGLK